MLHPHGDELSVTRSDGGFVLWVFLCSMWWRLVSVLLRVCCCCYSQCYVLLSGVEAMDCEASSSVLWMLLCAQNAIVLY